MPKETKFELALTDTIPEDYVRIISELTAMYPETINGFKKYMFEEFVLFCKKQYDYGPGNIAVGTQLKTQKEIMISLKGLLFRMNDKIQRLFNIIMIKDSFDAVNESVEDAWADLSVYSKICKLVKHGKWLK